MKADLNNEAIMMSWALGVNHERAAAVFQLKMIADILQKQSLLKITFPNIYHLALYFCLAILACERNQSGLFWGAQQLSWV